MILRTLTPVLLLLLLCGVPSVAIGEEQVIPLAERYRQALTADPDNRNLRYQLGVALLQAGQDLEALEAFRQAYPALADSAELNFNLGLTYSRLGDPDSALLYFEQAEALGALQQPELFPLHNAYFNVALLYAEREQLHEAADLLEKLLQLAPERYDLYRLLGDYYARSGQIEPAVASLSRYLEESPEDSEIREYAFALVFNRALQAMEHGRPEQARLDLIKALSFLEAHPRVYYYLAYLDYQQQDYAAVVERLTTAYPSLSADVQESARAILYNSALALREQGDNQTAARALAPLVNEVRPRVKDLFQMGSLLLAQEQYNQARQRFEQVLSLEPGHPGGGAGLATAQKGAIDELLVLGKRALDRGDYQAALRALQTAQKLAPGDNRIQIHLAKTERLLKRQWQKPLEKARELLASGERLAALEQLRKGLRIAPQESALLELEAQLLHELATEIEQLQQQGEDAYAAGELERARLAFTQLLELNPRHQAALDALRRIDQQQAELASRAVAEGETALAAGELLAARASFARALTVAPGLPAARDGAERTEELLTSRTNEALEQGRRALGAGRPAAARDIYARALQRWQDPLLADELKQVEQAIEEQVDSLTALARAAIGRREFSQARQLLQRGLLLHPKYEALQQALSLLDERLSRAVSEHLQTARQELLAGRFDEGLKAYRRALDLDPGSQQALQGLQQGKQRLGESISQLLAEASTARAAGQHDEARNAYRRVLALDPHQAEALNSLKQLERVGRAGLSPEDGRRLYLEGIEFYTQGQYQKAMASWRQVLDLDPGHEKARMNIEKARRKLQQIRERQDG